jgi:hypothetical protein
LIVVCSVLLFCCAFLIEDAEAVFNANKGVQKDLCMFMSNHQIVAGQNYNKPIENVANLKYLGMAVTNQNYIHGVIRTF